MIINPDDSRHAVDSPVGKVYLRTFGAVADIETEIPGTPKIGAFLASEPDELLGPFQKALSEAEFEHHLDMPVNLKKIQEKSQFLGESRPFLQADVPVPEDSVLVAMKIDHGIMQFYLPESEAYPKGAYTFMESPEPGYARFIMPISRGEPGETFKGQFNLSRLGGLQTVVHFFKVKIVKELKDLVSAPVTALAEYIAQKIEARLKEEQFLRLTAAGFPPVDPPDLNAMADQSSVLFIHGIFSSVEGAFQALGGGDGSVLDKLSHKYSDRLIGWDHWTISKTMTENAKDLLDHLPDGMDVHIVCHSRGAAVTRALLEDPALAPLREKKLPKVRKVIFVAGANQGSSLANGDRLIELINAFSGILSVTKLASGIAPQLIVGLLKVVLHGIFDVPSVRDLRPDSKFYQLLNKPPYTPVEEYCYARANFDVTGISAYSALDTIIDGYMQEPNDLVIPFKGAMTFDPGVNAAIPVKCGKDYGTSDAGQSTVLHTNFFEQKAVRDLLLDKL